MIIALLILEVFVLGYIDYRIYGTPYTPVIVLGAPFIVVVLFNLYWAESSGLVPLYLPALWVWVIGLFLFWLPGLFLSVVFIRKTNIVKNPFKELNIKDPGLILFLKSLSIILILIMYSKLISSITKFDFGSNELSKSLSRGIAAHASVWILIPVTYFLTTSAFTKKHFLNWIIILLWLFFAFSYNSKTWILIPIIASLIGRILIFNNKITMKKALALLGVGVIIFFLSYSISFGYWAPWWFIKNHFTFYTNAGLLSFSEYIRLNREIGISMEFLFEPFFNVYYQFFGHKVESIISNLNIYLGNQYYSNVKTFFGEIYIYGGVAGGIFTSFVWGGFCYLYLLLNVLFKDISLFIIYLIIIAALFFGWFGIYYNNLAYYELIIASTVIVILTTIIFKNGRLKITKF